jgi:hypothetical protein
MLPAVPQTGSHSLPYPFRCSGRLRDQASLASRCLCSAFPSDNQSERQQYCSAKQIRRIDLPDEKQSTQERSTRLTNFLPAALMDLTVCFRQACATPVQKRAVIQGRSALTPGVLRKKEIHVISDAIAEVMADGPHTI